MIVACRAHRQTRSSFGARSLGDVRLLHEFELDEASNALAGTKPRDWPTFRARWEEILADVEGTRTGVTPRVILADDVVVGAVNISPHDGRDSIGYWIAREHWGRGIASRAVALMLGEFARRPLSCHGGRAQPAVDPRAGKERVQDRVAPHDARNSAHRATRNRDDGAGVRGARNRARPWPVSRVFARRPTPAQP
jgi:hypothetical protein